MEQLDWIQLEDHRVAAGRMLDQACHRIGVGELAHRLGEDPSTLVHQLKRDGGKRPSGDLVLIALLLDREFRERLVGLRGEVLTRPADLTPEQVANEIGVLAGAKGYASKEEVFALLFRMRKADQAAALRAVP